MFSPEYEEQFKTEMDQMIKLFAQQYDRFLLSIDELNTYFPDEDSRIAEATEYAVVQGGRVSRETGKTCWWLAAKRRRMTLP